MELEQRIHATYDRVIKRNALRIIALENANTDISQQLATAKAEIAEYREAIECLIIERGIHDSYDGGLLPDSEQSDTIQAAFKLLVKHKGE